MARPRETNNYYVVGDVCYIDISTPKHPTTFALIDTSDVVRVLDPFAGKWSPSQSANGTIYVRRNHSPPLHAVVLCVSDGRTVDHKNSDGLDNRRGNLRLATAMQNQANQRPIRGGSSAYKGVCWHKNQRKWTAYILGGGGKRRHLGSFGDEIQAAKVYDQAAIEVFGEFAQLNFTPPIDNPLSGE